MRHGELSHVGSNVLVLQERAGRDPAKMYKDFYDRYGSPDFKTDHGRVTSLVLSGRVLHQNIPGGADRSRHIIVGQLENARWVSSHVSMPSRPNAGGRPRSGDSDFRPQHHIVYSPYSFFVAACDGVSQSAYDVRVARSVYDHPIDVRHPRDDAAFEFLTLEIEDEYAGPLELTFHRGSGNGLLKSKFARRSQPNEPFWILSAEESQLERSFALSNRVQRNREQARSIAQIVFAA